MPKRPILTTLAFFFALPAVMHAAVSDTNGNGGMSNIHWPDDQQLPTFAEADHLHVADVLDASGDDKLLLATLQGVVNKQQPRIYLFENDEEGKYTWLDDLDVPYEVHDDHWDVVDKFKDEIEGMIVYDPQLMDTVNVATTLAGIKNAVVVSPELAEKMQSEPFNMDILVDLQGKFTDKLEAYRWQYEHLWDQTTDRMLVGLSPGTSIPIPPGIPSSFDTVAQDTTQEREANNRDIYTFDLSAYLEGEAVYVRFDDAFPEDGWGPAVHEVTVKADGEVIAHFIAGTAEEEAFLYDRERSQLSDGQGGHRFADHDRYFVYRFEPPSSTEELTISIDMWNQYTVSVSDVQPLSSEQKEAYGYLRDYAVANQAMVFWLNAHIPEERVLLDEILSEVAPGTPYFGWFADDIEGEFEGVEYLSSYGVYVVPADWFSNLTVFSGTSVQDIETERSPAPPLENKIYVTYTFGEGDNFQYNQHRMRILWDDPARGQVPINWTSSPLLYDGAPAILNHFRETATENDLLVAGPSGVGYYYPHAWPEEHFPEFLSNTYSYMANTGMDIPYVLNRHGSENIPLTDSIAAAYEAYYDAPGLFLSWENSSGLTLQNGTLPVSTIRGIGSVEEGKRALESAKADWDGQSPKFVSIGLLAWNIMPSNVVELTDSLGTEFEIVNADHYFSLIREAYDIPTPSLSVLQQTLERFIQDEYVSDALAAQLRNRLNQAEHHLNKGNVDKAMTRLEDFRNRLERDVFDPYVSDHAQHILMKQVEALLHSE